MARNVSEKDQVWIVYGIAGLTLVGLAFLLKKSLPLEHSASQPDRQPGSATSYDDVFPESLGEHFVRPNEIQNPVVLPVRYPVRAGHEISVIIEKGIAPLFQPRPALNTWVTCPPSENG